MKKSIISAVEKNGIYKTKKYTYKKKVTPDGFFILRYDKEHYYPCVVLYVQK